jgi:hypothetical protein
MRGSLIIGALLLLSLRAEAQAVFIEVHGKVEIRSPGASGWTAAAEGMNIDRETVISTGFKSGAVIQVLSSRILLRPLTHLSLESIIAGEGSEEIELSLRAGRIRTEAPPPAGRPLVFTVRSPMVVASVRGTSFEFDTVNLLVDKGLVRYSYINGFTVYVAEGEGSYAEDEARRVVPPQELAAAGRIPKIPLYTGVEDPPADPRYFAIGGGSSTLRLSPGWIP